MTKKIKDMTDEELNERLEREYKEAQLKEIRRRKFLARIALIIGVPFLVMMAIICALPIIGVIVL